MLFILRMCIILAIALILFLLTGIVHVKKERIVIIHRGKKFIRALNAGTYYYFPLVFQLTKQLPALPSTVTFSLQNGKILAATLQIKNPKLYFQSRPDVKKTLEKIYSVVEDENKTRLIAARQFENMGIELLSLIVTEQ